MQFLILNKQQINNTTMEDDYQMFKIVVIGSTGTGKTNIATRYIRNEFNQSQKATVGVQFLSKINIKVTLWDTAGQQRYKSLSKVYYKGASGVLIVYDVTQPQSYLDVQSWMRLANQNLNLNEVVLMIVGNKIDLENERKVPTDRAMRQYKQKFDIDCWEVSAKTGYNVREIFTELLQRIYEKNIEIKSSAFQDVSDYGSVAESVVGNRKTINNPKPSQVPIQEVIMEEDINPAPPPKNIMPPVAPPKEQKQKPKQNTKPAKDERMTLKASTEKKRLENEKEKKKGCC